MKEFGPFSFTHPIALGVATAPTQIEGFPTENSWYDWASIPGKIVDGSSPLRANEHWTRYKEDIDLMASLHIRHYRLGLEWSRIEPQEGRFDEVAVAHYREELSYLLEKGIRPLVTLHHFSNPSWFERRGGFLSKDSIDIFLRYVRYAVAKISDLCSEFITVNEPNVYAVNGYLYGIWPPGRKKISQTLSVMKRLAVCHLRACQAVREIYGDKPVRVGYANHFRIFRSPSEKVPARIQTRLFEYLFQDGITRLMTTGRGTFPFGLFSGVKKGLYCDFIGINYYTRCTMKGFNELPVPASSPRNDLGWELYPGGIRLLAKKYYERFGLPVWITENGTADAADGFRSLYLFEHLQELALNGSFVERYYHWTFIDNFEWAEGETARFGLVGNDFERQKRTVRRSGHFYADIISNRGVTPAMIDQYLSPDSD
jgi:beta-glucosidase